MYYIALQILFNNKSKYISMIAGISFATLIISQQSSIFLGLMELTYSFVQDIKLPDIWVMDPRVQFVEEHKPIKDTYLWRIKEFNEVEWAVPLYKTLLETTLQDGNQKQIDLTGFDDISFIGAPSQIVQGNLYDLRNPNSIFVDIGAAKKRFRIKTSDQQIRSLMIGDILEINNKKAKVVGFMKTTHNFVNQPQIYTSITNALNYTFPNRNQINYILIKLKAGADLKGTCLKIMNDTGLLALSAQEFKDQNLKYWMDNTGIPINFGMAVILGFIMGILIVGQIFFNFVQENIKYFAILKVMGLKKIMLIKMVILQAFTVAIIGYGIGLGATSLIGLNINKDVLAFHLSPFLLLLTCLGTFSLVFISAILGILHVIRVDPCTVFKE